MNYLAVFIGGGIGSLMRFGMSMILPRDEGTFPWATFFANTAATVILALVVVWLGRDKTGHDQMWYLLLGIGLCGGFSTFSTFSLETIDLWRTGHAKLALLYSGATLVACLGAMAMVLSFLKQQHD